MGGITVSSFDGRASVATHRLLSAANSDNATLVLAKRVAITNIQGHNAKASAVYVKLYDKATAPASTDTPRKTIYIPASTAFAFDYANGMEFTLGLGYRMVTGNADNDATAVAAGDILGFNIDYVI
jgi:hypothetical protein